MDDEQKLVRYQSIVDTLEGVTPSAPRAPHVIDLVTFEPRLEASGVALTRRTPTP
jgi:hypothetical protein